MDALPKDQDEKVVAAEDYEEKDAVHEDQDGEDCVNEDYDAKDVVPEDQDEGQVHVSHERPPQHPGLLVKALHVAGDGMEQSEIKGY